MVRGSNWLWLGCGMTSWAALSSVLSPCPEHDQTVTTHSDAGRHFSAGSQQPTVNTLRAPVEVRSVRIFEVRLGLWREAAALEACLQQPV